VKVVAGSIQGFPKHFDGRRFYNPGAPQAPGYLDVLRWKLTSWPEPSPRFIADIRAPQLQYSPLGIVCIIVEVERTQSFTRGFAKREH